MFPFQLNFLKIFFVFLKVRKAKRELGYEIVYLLSFPVIASIFIFSVARFVTILMPFQNI